MYRTFDVVEWTEAPATVLPVIKELMNSGISVWLYSGDTDAVVAVTTTRYAIDLLQTSVKTKFYPRSLCLVVWDDDNAVHKYTRMVYRIDVSYISISCKLNQNYK
ncbi:hypothetical protein POM88_043294 [Heracleum sosnowskyi]|uniref:Uncharacterized protein n=1 Tax=Heracleum sosnowskyi TaxID=360622 RepID=A0AAD8H0T8_9APIA|nr:hypothetical protein POM88_043294 [Heracleum sosnowskyi]